jgi:hypothetical protein
LTGSASAGSSSARLVVTTLMGCPGQMAMAFSSCGHMGAITTIQGVPELLAQG